MAMIESIALIVGVASSLVNLLSQVKEISQSQKDKAILFLENVATTIDEAVIKFKNDEVPHGSCEMMRQYSNVLPEILDGVIDSSHLEEYSSMLYRAHDIEQFFISVKRDENSLNELEKAAGLFRAAAVLVKCS